MAKKGFAFKQYRQGGGWKGYWYMRAKNPGNAAALAVVRERVHDQCKGVKDVQERKTCFSVVARGGTYK